MDIPGLVSLVIELVEKIEREEDSLADIGSDEHEECPDLFKGTYEYRAMLIRFALNGEVDFKGNTYTSVDDLDEAIISFINRYNFVA